MWKKDDVSETGTNPKRPEATPPRNEAPVSRSATGQRATIGRSITIKGEVTGDEDLLIQGKVDGSVDLKQHSVTVGPEGQVKAGITGRIVTVEGSVEGNLKAQEQVILRSTARVEGDITAARVVLEDGATFRGGVDMGNRSEEGARSSGSARSTGRESRTEATKSGSGTSSDRAKKAEDASKESAQDRTGKATGATT